MDNYLKWHLDAAVSGNYVTIDYYSAADGFIFPARLIFYGFDAGNGGGCDMLRAWLDNSGIGREIQMTHIKGVTYV